MKTSGALRLGADLLRALCLVAALGLGLVGCGGGSDNTPPSSPQTPLYGVNGVVSGLVGSGLQLSLNGGAALGLNNNGPFAFPTLLAIGTNYTVAIARQPSSPTQNCTVSNATGTVNGTVFNVQVSCTTQVTVGGVVSGLAGSGLQLSINGGSSIAINANGSFTAPGTLGQGTAYNIAVVQQPAAPAQICAVTNGSGVAGATNITDVQISCLTINSIGGVVQGLVGSGLQLSLNGGAAVPVTSNGAFAFPTQLLQGASYSVAVAQQPSAPGQACTVANGTGTVAGPVNNVQINCPSIAAANFVVAAGQKRLNFTWDAVPGAASHQLQQQVDDGTGTPPWTDVGTALSGAATTTGVDVAVHRTDWVNTKYRLRSCNAGGCTVSTALPILSQMLDAVVYAKASNTDAGDRLGYAVSLSADGNTLAVGAFTESSSATGINGNQADNSAPSSGAVYVFTRSGATWSQQAYVKASNTDAGDFFGFAVSLSADGNTLAVGARDEDSNATGINGNQADNSATWSGAAYVFTRSGATWSQQAYVKASNTGAFDQFGFAVSLSADGNTLAVGAFTESSSATGINGNQADNSAHNSGAVYVFTRSGATWSQQAYVKASNTDAGDFFGFAVSLSADGNTLAVGASLEGSNATGIDGNQVDNSATWSGAAYVFTRSSGTWSQQAYVKASNSDADNRFGSAISLSADGDTLAVGAPREDSNATGINGNQADGSATASGAVYVFTRSGATWSQQAYVKATNTGATDWFGWSVSLSADGNTLAVGALYEDSSATGINGSQADDSAPNSGAVYVFSRSNSSWSQRSYVKASNSDAGDTFGHAVSLSTDGSTLAVSAPLEDGSATGINGNRANSSATNSGAVYVY